MNNIEQLLITSFSLNSLQGSNNPLLMLVGLGGIYIVKEIGLLVPPLMQWMKSKCKKKMEETVTLPIVTNNVTSCIEFKRDYKSNFVTNKLIDAIVDYICRHNNVKYLLLKEFFIFNNKTEIEISKDIFLKLHNIQFDSTGQLQGIHFQLYSFVLPLNELRVFCDDLLEKQIHSQQNTFKKEKYYFKTITNGYFTKTRFETTKSLDNLFGQHIKTAKNRLDLFIQQPEWYKKKGIPYSLGFLLYGVPGCGKTSFIKAIAHDTNRHIVNLELTKETKYKTFYNLFFTDQLDQHREMVKVPIDQRIYVIEDADCLTDIVTDRDIKKEETKTKKEESYEKAMAKLVQEQDNELLNFSHLLNILDGVLETPGRIIIMTTNHIDRIDPALKRPGRFDLVMEFSKCTVETIKEMYVHFYEETIDIPLEFDNQFTPAEVQEGLLRHLDHHEGFIEFLKNKLNKDLFKENEKINVSCENKEINIPSDVDENKSPVNMLRKQETLENDHSVIPSDVDVKYERPLVNIVKKEYDKMTDEIYNAIDITDDELTQKVQKLKDFEDRNRHWLFLNNQMEETNAIPVGCKPKQSGKRYATLGTMKNVDLEGVESHS